MKLCTAKGILLLVSFCIPLVSISNLPFLLILWKSMSDGFKSEAKKGRGILFSRLTEENLWWKMTFVRKQPLMEDDIWWKTTFHGRPNFYLDKKICKNLHLSWVRIGGWQTDVLDVWVVVCKPLFSSGLNQLQNNDWVMTPKFFLQQWLVPNPIYWRQKMTEWNTMEWRRMMEWDTLEWRRLIIRCGRGVE